MAPGDGTVSNEETRSQTPREATAAERTSLPPAEPKQDLGVDLRPNSGPLEVNQHTAAVVAGPPVEVEDSEPCAP